MACLFDKDETGLEGGDWEKLFTEYVDISGIGETIEFDLLLSIHNIQVRMTFIASMVELQKRFFKEFNMPFLKAFEDFKKYGHRISWDASDPGKFITELQRIEVRERRFQSELDVKVKELKKLKKDGVQPNTDGRKDFVRQLNNLGKVGYKIDRDKTDMEELALMIKDQNSILKDQVNNSK